MKIAIIVSSMLVGLVLGTTIATATAATPTVAHSAPAPEPVQVATTPTIVTWTKVTVITAEAPKPPVRKVKAPAKEKQLMCRVVWSESQVGGQYKTCEWM